MIEKILGIVKIPEKKGMEIQCACGHRWIYAGKSERYCSCPKCRTTITIKKKNKKSSLQAEESLERKHLHVMTEKTASESESRHD